MAKRISQVFKFGVVFFPSKKTTKVPIGGHMARRFGTVEVRYGSSTADPAEGCSPCSHMCFTSKCQWLVCWMSDAHGHFEVPDLLHRGLLHYCTPATLYIPCALDWLPKLRIAGYFLGFCQILVESDGFILGYFQ